MPIYTVFSSCREFGLHPRRQFTPLSDAALDDLVSDCINHIQWPVPNAVKARLFSRGHHVQRWRVRESMLRVDPRGGVAIRTAMTISRRTYTVAGPKSTWHIDSNMKLSRYILPLVFLLLWTVKLHMEQLTWAQRSLYINADGEWWCMAEWMTLVVWSCFFMPPTTIWRTVLEQLCWLQQANMVYLPDDKLS